MTRPLTSHGPQDDASRLPAGVASATQPVAEPLEELVLELTDLGFQEDTDLPRVTARARLVYHPAAPGDPEVASVGSWRFVAPLGPVQAEELRWYLEKYAVWPSRYFRDRARKVEETLVQWGRLLYDGAMPPAHTANVVQAWARVGDHADRRFSVHVDAGAAAGSPDAEAATAREAAAALLGLPWELLHDGGSFLFQGAKPTRVRRRLPNSNPLDVPVVAPPIRVLLVTARPEDDACRYIDHRVSALPLVDAVETLPGFVSIHVLSPPTFPALCDELERADWAGEPYHVVHFDGHGVYDRRVGRGGLCFEDPEDEELLEARRHVTVFPDELGPLLGGCRVPLVFLEACQSAQAEKAPGSVASALLEAGVASVVAMSHSVLVETSRRFVEAFYGTLARGGRVGDAVLHGQRRLKDDLSRGRIFGEGELRLEDWFVPVLFQERDDPQLFLTTPSPRTREDFARDLALRLGALPPEPETGFVGRSRELLALQRLLLHDRYAVVLGQGGEGKTALAVELARWMVRSHQVRRAAFVSVEKHSHAAAVLDAIGRQLVGDDYSVARFDGLDRALEPVAAALAEEPTLLVVDNVESILLPPFMAAAPDALAEETRRELDAILALCARLNESGDTRLVFTSREALPAPFDAAWHRRELYRLDTEDAVKLVERALNGSGNDAGAPGDAALEEIERLVESVHGHARTLALLAPSLRDRGVEATRASLMELMEEMERAFPGSRERSVFASVELSLRRLSPENRTRARVLGVFHGVVDTAMLSVMMEWEVADVLAMAAELVQTGLATEDPHHHLTLHPALSPYLRGRMDAAERERLTAAWGETMRRYVGFLTAESRRRAEFAATLTVLELPNLFALLDQVQRAGDAEATMDLAISLHTLLRISGRPRLLERIARVRDAVAPALGEAWSHARFEALRMQVERHLASGRLQEALDEAQRLLQRARAAGESAYPDVDHDLALATFLVGEILSRADRPEDALPLISEAQAAFEAIAAAPRGGAAESMASVCASTRASCLYMLGRLDEAAAAYEEVIRRGEQRGDEREVAGAKGELATVRMGQQRYLEAVENYTAAREAFTRLDEPGNVAKIWHNMGIALAEAGRPEDAEDAYLQALMLDVRLGHLAGQAGTLVQLANLYDEALDRREEAVTLYRQAADTFVELRDQAKEAMVRSNLADTLCKLRRLDEARQECLRAIELSAAPGYASTRWNAWVILANIETAAGNAAAAAEARRKATAAYLAYRRDGGENHYSDGRIALAVSQALSAGEQGQATSLLQQLSTQFREAGPSTFLNALQAIVDGARDPALADAPELDHTMAAEILLLLETLDGRDGTSQGSSPTP